MRPPAVILLSAFGSLALGVVVTLIEARLATAATSSICASTTPCVQQMQVRLAPAEPGELSAQLPGRSTTLVDVPGAGEFSRGVYIAKAMPRTHQVDWGVFNRAGGAASGFGSVGRYGVVRWAEDWSVLRDNVLGEVVYVVFEGLLSRLWDRISSSGPYLEWIDMQIAHYFAIVCKMLLKYPNRRAFSV